MGTLPSKLHLPGGLVVTVTAKGAPRPFRRRPRMPLFSEMADALASGLLWIEAAGAPIVLMDLPLATFHALRALLAHGGWLYEEPIEISCRNCGRTLVVSPCAAMPIGPFTFGEL